MAEALISNKILPFTLKGRLLGGAMFHASIRQTPYGIIAYIADEDLVGRAFVDEERQVYVIVSEKNYGGALIGEKEAEQVLAQADYLVLTGERIVNLAVKAGIVHPDSILYVKGIPHAHVIKMRM